jgi:hypothetical protein
VALTSVLANVRFSPNHRLDMLVLKKKLNLILKSDHFLIGQTLKVHHKILLSVVHHYGQ